MTADRRQRLRLLLRDLGAGAAFASMAVSGQVAIWACAAFAIALIIALFRRRPFTGRPALTAGVLALAGLALYGQVAVGQADLVVTACTFAGFIGAHRLLSRPTPNTDNQVHLTSLLMIAGGAALSGELLFALCLLIFSVCASLALGLGVIDPTGTVEEDLPLRPLLRPLGFGVTAAILGGIAFFVLFPRLSWNVAARRVSPGLGGTPTTGFADRVRLGGDGSIKKNPRIVLRATLTPDPGVDALHTYWIGRTYDRFRGDEWVGQGEVRRPQGQVDLRFRTSNKNLIHQKIELLPAYDARTLIALDPPVRVGNAVAHTAGATTRTELIEVDGEEVRFAERALGYSYHAYSLPGPAKQDGLEENAERYLSLPAKLDPRIPALAKQIVGEEKDPLAAARALEAWLKREYRYTLELSGDVADPLADFLFVTREGHCEHFATALTILLRTLGIPARVATGFFGGERIGGQYVVRAGDAHAWTQVLIHGKGFLTLDATPEAQRGGQPAQWLEWLTRQYEAIDALWRSVVIDYSFSDQAALIRSLVRPPSRAATGEEGRGGAGFRLPGTPRLLGAAAAVIVLLLVLRGWFRPRTSRATHDATALLTGLERFLVQRASLRPLLEELGVEGVAARLRDQAHPLASPVGKVTRRYVEARFGRRPLALGEKELLLRGLEKAAPRAP